MNNELLNKALHRDYSDDLLDALHEAFMLLPACALLGVIGDSIQEIQSLRQAQPVQPKVKMPEFTEARYDSTQWIKAKDVREAWETK